MTTAGCRPPTEPDAAPGAETPVEIAAPAPENTDDGFDLRWLVAAGVLGAAATGAVLTRRKFLGMSALVGAAVVAPEVKVRRAAATSARPNIVWFRSEDNSAEFIGAYGNPLARTPNIDRLASGGVLFRRFFTTSPVCAPTKLGWATGMYEAGMGPGQNMRAHGKRPEEAIGFATWLSEAGYRCVTSGNVDYNTDLDDHGFADTAGDWQSQALSGQPFLALLGSSTTHEGVMANAVAGQTSPAAVALPPYVPDDPVLRSDRAAYFDKVSEMDAEVGALVAELTELGVLDNTIVIYSSDHGGVVPRSKRFCYDSGLHAPLVAWFPEAWRHLAPGGPGTVIDEPVSSIDAAPTMLHLAGVEIPQHFQGQPFAGATCAPREFAFSNRNRMDEAIDFVRTVRDVRYRYIRNYMPHLIWGQHLSFMWRQAGYRRWEQLHNEGTLDATQDRFWKAKPYEELYDLDADPYEVNNVIDDPEHRDRLEELRAALDAHMIAINDNGFIPESSEAEGYNESREPGAYPLEALMALGELAAQRDPNNLAALEAALSDTNEIVRYWGALGCSMLGNESAPATDTLIAHLTDSDEAPWVRVQSADAIARQSGQAGRSEAISYLSGVAAEESVPFAVRLQAVQSLVQLGPEALSAREALVRAAGADNEYVAAAGQHGLAVIDGTYAPAP